MSENNADVIGTAGRTRSKRLNRKTKAFSRSTDMHNIVIGNLIETMNYYWYQQIEYLTNTAVRNLIN